MNPEGFERLVTDVVPSLLSEDIPVEVGGSGSLLLRGAEVQPGDLDLLAPRESLSALQDVVPDGSVDTTHTELWRTSWIYRWGSVEVLGGAVLVDGSEHWDIPVGDPDYINLNGVDIPLSPLAVWVRIYRVIGSDRLSIAESLD